MENNNNTREPDLIVGLIDFPEDFVCAVLHLKHNGASTRDAVLFFHLFWSTAPAPLLLFKPEIYL